MLQKLSNIIVEFLINRKNIEEKDKEIYLYGAMLFLSTLAGILSIILISILFFDLATVLIFFVFFTPLRVHSGGYHCKKYMTCFIVSNIIFVLIVLFSKFVFNYFSFICSLISIGSSLVTLIIVILLSPVINANNALSPGKKEKNRKKSITYATISFFIILILSLVNINRLDYYICVASFSELSIAILMIMEKIIERRNKKCLNI